MAGNYVTSVPLGRTAVTPEAMTRTRRYIGGMGAERAESAGVNQAIMWGSVALLTLGVFWATTRPGGGLAPNPRRKPTRRYTRGRGGRISRRYRTGRRTSRRGTRRRATKRRTSRRGTKRRARSRRRTSRRRKPTRRYSRRHGGYIVRRPVVNNRLTAAERRRIPKSKFVFPERRAWPLDTKKRARAAVSYLHMGRVKSASDFNKIRNAIRKKYPDVWERYGKGLTWDKAKRAKRKRGRSKGRTTRKAAN